MNSKMWSKHEAAVLPHRKAITWFCTPRLEKEATEWNTFPNPRLLTLWLIYPYWRYTPQVRPNQWLGIITWSPIMDIQSEHLAYWYLRLNGFLTIVNFVVHPDVGRNQETDVDVLGVRFPYRAENLINPMRDDHHFTKIQNKSLVVIAEVKSGRCALNGPWTKPERRNMQRVLRAVGAFPEHECELVAESLYNKGQYISQLYHVTLLCFGREMNQEVRGHYKKVPQILWPDVLSFIYRRFHEYRTQKVSHPQWDSHGQDLWRTFEQSSTEDAFTSGVRIL